MAAWKSALTAQLLVPDSFVDTTQALHRWYWLRITRRAILGKKVVFAAGVGPNHLYHWE